MRQYRKGAAGKMDFGLWRRCRDEDTMVMRGGGVEARGLTPGSGVQWGEEEMLQAPQGESVGFRESVDTHHCGERL